MLSRFTLWWRVCDKLKNKEELISLLRLLQQLLLVSFFLLSDSFFPGFIEVDNHIGINPDWNPLNGRLSFLFSSD